MSFIDSLKSLFKAPKVDLVANARLEAFASASDACDAAFLAVDPYTDRCHYLQDLDEIERRLLLQKSPYYTEAYLDAHTAAIDTLEIAFDAITAAVGALNPSASFYPSAATLFKEYASLFRIHATAYWRATLFAGIDGANGALQALKDNFDVGLLEYKAANPSTANPDEAKAKAAAARAKVTEDTASARALKQKAEAAKDAAEILLAKAKAAEAKAEEALKVRQ